eukprot:EG_transcript_42892
MSHSDGPAGLPETAVEGPAKRQRAGSQVRGKWQQRQVQGSVAWVHQQTHAIWGLHQTRRRVRAEEAELRSALALSTVGAAPQPAPAGDSASSSSVTSATDSADVAPDSGSQPAAPNPNPAPLKARWCQAARDLPRSPP